MPKRFFRLSRLTRLCTTAAFVKYSFARSNPIGKFL